MKRQWLLSAAICGLLICTQGLPAQEPGRPGGPPRQGGPQGQPPRINPVLRLFDANRDGTLSESEIENAAAKLKELDSSKDGQISADELRGLLPMGGGRGMAGGGQPPLGGGRGGRGPGGPGGGSSAAASDFRSTLVPKNDFEKKIMAALAEMRTGPRFANVATDDGRLLRMLAETIGAKTVVEIGTSTGESGVWFALALRNTGGHLYTHEIDEGRAKVAAENFKKAGVDDLITIVMGDAHETVKQYKDPIDILFLDADKEGYIDYLEKLVPLIRPGGLIIAHNINARMADPRYVQEITTNPQFETFFLLPEGTGVGVTMKKR